MKMACSKFTAKREVDSENRQFKEEWTEKCAFILLRVLCEWHSAALCVEGPFVCVCV